MTVKHVWRMGKALGQSIVAVVGETAQQRYERSEHARRVKKAMTKTRPGR